jgi:hypothetical protein
MSINKVTIAIVVALFATPFVIPEAHAISASYRAKLERSGCTQVTEGNGTCDIHKTKAQNQARFATDPVIKERHEINAFLEDSVIGKSTDDAYKALSKHGFNNPEPLTWVKGKNKILVDVNSNSIVIAATLY